MNTAKYRIDDLYLLSGLTADLFYHEASKIMEEHAVRCGSIIIDMPPPHSEPEDAAGQPYPEPDIIFRPEQKKGPAADENNLKMENDGKPALNLYRWASRLPRAHGNGDIIVMAESLDQAREFARIQGRKYIQEQSSFIEMLRLNEELRVLEADLLNEPELIPAGVVLIRRSE
ncbi:hypothetical protein [Marinobacter orientalis]|uniref:Uncharacterized protein n=1 Tax=Marinobacter orientalis TaxID=1928859 RepID=A0A7Y0WTS3_9GAMM|nr:hypothetical protein [Marinobacter orientalis]NMT65020.1 hypothetical protein [Marinobacter orientalis]TGX48088.1 hypothetical protein DIT72_15820 [Marinobacter orientalis]